MAHAAAHSAQAHTRQQQQQQQQQPTGGIDGLYAAAAFVKEEPQHTPSVPAPKRQRLYPATPSSEALMPPPPGGGGSAAGAAGGVAQQQQQQPSNPEPDLFELLLDAASVAAAAAAGLTPELVGAFMALLDVLPPQQQAAKVGWGLRTHIGRTCEWH